MAVALKILGSYPYQMVKEFNDMYICLDTIPECDIHTYRQTDKWTDLLKQYRILHA